MAKLETFVVEITKKNIDKPLVRFEIKAKDYRSLREQVDVVRYEHRGTYHLVVMQLTERKYDENGELSEDSYTMIADHII